MLDDRPSQVILKTAAEIEEMRVSGRLVAETLQELVEMAQPGRRLAELDGYVLRKFERLGVVPTFLGYQGFPYTVCTSVNEQIVHGFPTDRILDAGRYPLDRPWRHRQRLGRGRGGYGGGRRDQPGGPAHH